MKLIWKNIFGNQRTCRKRQRLLDMKINSSAKRVLKKNINIIEII
jgi:hypothetical protein